MVKTYLQTAITQVHSAMSDMQAQTHDMHQQADGNKRQLQQDITHLDQECLRHIAEIGHLQNDSQRRAVESRISQIRSEIDAKKAQIGQIDTEVAHAQQRKDMLYKNMYNVTGELTRLMSLPDIG